MSETLMERLEGDRLTEQESLVLFGITLAQCEDVHAIAWSLDEEQGALAEKMLAELEEVKPRTPLSGALTTSLASIVHDLDHFDLPEDQWEAIEAVHARLSRKHGHTPSAMDGRML